MATPRESAEAYVERIHLRKLCEWISTDLVLQRPKDALRHLEDTLRARREKRVP